MGERAIDVRGASLEESRVVMAAVIRMRPSPAGAPEGDSERSGMRGTGRGAESAGEGGRAVLD